MNFTWDFTQHCLAQLFVLLAAAAEPKGLKNQEQKNHLTWNLKFWQKSSEVVAESKVEPQSQLLSCTRGKSLLESWGTNFLPD